MPENTQKHIDHTEEEIDIYLKQVKKCIKRGKFKVLNTDKRKENQEFIKKYRLNSKKLKEMLLAIDKEDFCYSADDYDNLGERLYIFAKEYELDYWGIKNNVLVYIKIALKENEFVVVISFHEPQKRIKKLFIKGK